MIERAGGAGLALEPFERGGVCGEIGREKLQRDETIELQVLRFVSLSHAAGAQRADDVVVQDGPADHGSGP